VPEGDAESTALQIIQSSVLYIVIITTIILGAIMPCFIKINLMQISKKSATRYTQEHPSVRDSMDTKFAETAIEGL
jgi:sodium/hydrogen exchanger-like protein 6/7/sodium/hydrogen exchanger 8